MMHIMRMMKRTSRTNLEESALGMTEGFAEEFLSTSMSKMRPISYSGYFTLRHCRSSLDKCSLCLLYTSDAADE